MLVYEYPLNESIRVYLRLEYLLLQMRAFINSSNPTDHHAALVVIFQILELTSRNDLRGDLLRDLKRQSQSIQIFKNSPDINQAVLDETLQQIEEAIDTQGSQLGRMGQSLVEDEWLSTIRNRVLIPGGTCSFDLPSYAAWLNLPAKERHTNLLDWIETFSTYEHNLMLLLRLTRSSVVRKKTKTINKMYQQALPSDKVYQYAAVYLPEGSRIYPLISGTRMMLAIRFQNLTNITSPVASIQGLVVDEDLEFELGLAA